MDPSPATRRLRSSTTHITEEATSTAAMADTVFRLLDLPGEIKNIIYEYALTDDGPVRLRGRKSYLARVPDTDSQLKTTVLRLNRQVNKEALPVLYGMNHFRFTSATIMAKFLTNIGTSLKYIKHIILEDWTPKSSIVRAFNLLKGATRLRSVTIRDNFDNQFAVHLPILRPFMVSLIKSNAERRSKEEMLSIMKVHQRGAFGRDDWMEGHTCERSLAECANCDKCKENSKVVQAGMDRLVGLVVPKAPKPAVADDDADTANSDWWYNHKTY